MVQDNLVIPGRTRYPSSAATDPQFFDLRIAKKLLTYEASHNRDAKRHVSNHSAALSYGSAQRDTTAFVEKFNSIANQYQLHELAALVDDAAPQKALVAETPARPKRGLWRKLVRSSSSKDLSDNPPLVKKNSFSNMLGRQPRLALKCQSLDAVFRLGGISVLQLPLPCSAVHLAIPTCLAATANYLVEHGRRTAGIFRIPGQANIVQTLYHHYVSQIHDAELEREHVHTTIGAPSLPKDLSYGTHDVASTFKKFLWDLPGGILGSVPLYKALQDVTARFDCREVQPKLCALAILSLTSSRRIAIISAVFGLLALIKQDPLEVNGIPVTPSRLLSPESMSSKALSVVFAPILLGSLTDQIELRQPTDGDRPAHDRNMLETPRRNIKHAFRTPKHRKSNSTDRTPEIAAHIERTNAASAIIEVLVKRWEEIAAQMHLLDGRLGSQRSSRSSKSSSNLSRCHPPLTQDSAHDDAGILEHPIHRPSHLHLKIPNLARSISLRQIPHLSSLDGSDGSDPSETDLILDNGQPRWPSLKPVVKDRVTSSSDNIGNENLPWWERKALASFRTRRPADTSQSSLNQTQRLASDCTTLITPSCDRACSKNSRSPCLDRSYSEPPGQAKQKIREVDIASDSGAAVSANETSSFIARNDQIVIPRFVSLEGNVKHPLPDAFNKTSTTPASERPDDKTMVTESSGELATTSSSRDDDNSRRITPSPAMTKTCGNVFLTPYERFRRAASDHNQEVAKQCQSESQSHWPLPNQCKRSTSSNSYTTEAFSRSQWVQSTAQHIDGKQTTIIVKTSPSMIPRPTTSAGRARSVAAHANPRPGSNSPPEYFRERSQCPHVWTRPRQPPSLNKLRSTRGQITLQQNTTSPEIPKSEGCAQKKPRRSLQAGALTKPPIARRLEFQRPCESRTPTRHASLNDCEDPNFWRNPNAGYQKGVNVGTLYAEITALREQLVQARRESSAWRSRAEWAEKVATGRSRNE